VTWLKLLSRSYTGRTMTFNAWFRTSRIIRRRRKLVKNRTWRDRRRPWELGAGWSIRRNWDLWRIITWVPSCLTWAAGWKIARWPWLNTKRGGFSNRSSYKHPR
jgi:hypothetical protein